MTLYTLVSTARTGRLVKPLAIALAFLLSACASDEPEEEVFCPETAVVQDALNLVRFSGQGRDLTDVLFETRIDEAVMACTYDDDEHAIDGNLRIALFATRGPANSSRQASFRYFVAIASADRQILAREEFEVIVPFEGNRTQVASVEELEPTIPLAPEQNGGEYTIFVGLVLTQEELEYNRANR